MKVFQQEESSSATLSRNDRGSNESADSSTTVIGQGSTHQVAPGVYASTVNVHVQHNAHVGRVNGSNGGDN